jgi:hypothetical protein
MNGNCQERRNRGDSVTDTVYLDPDGAAKGVDPFPVYCEMTVYPPKPGSWRVYPPTGIPVSLLTEQDVIRACIYTRIQVFRHTIVLSHGYRPSTNIMAHFCYWIFAQEEVSGPYKLDHTLHGFFISRNHGWIYTLY